ncbi:hypothetical protein [Halobacillus trueperi]|uniref:Uncharacterized protein n=1 Tax=Halobacillus trueperi TaxID=156205 RepID=A0A3E0J1Z3_9BACI|nr:hypothetical protein [Halobacillus trueperi]REJ06932.1 hypothetical protein DYE48_17520 [Halobacillus trueperi]
MDKLNVEIVNSCEGLDCISIVDWLQFFGAIGGAFLGTLIAGLVTLSSVKKQLVFSRDMERKRELDNFIKLFTAISYILSREITYLEKFIEKIKVTNDTKHIENLLKDLAVQLESKQDDLRRFDYVSVPPTLYMRISGIDSVMNDFIASFMKVNFEEDYIISESEKQKFIEITEGLYNNVKKFQNELIAMDEQSIAESKLLDNKWNEKNTGTLRYFISKAFRRKKDGNR